MKKQQKTYKTYKRFCDKCGVYFQPLTKFSRNCEDCKRLIKQKAAKKSSDTQKKKLTKKQKLINKKEKHKLTKTYALKQSKKLLKQQDRDWSAKVRELQPTCLLCGSTASLQSHHCIPREIRETRHEPLNGVTLCAKHHKWGIFSAHRNPVWFIHKLEILQPKTYNFVFNKIPILDLTESDKI